MQQTGRHYLLETTLKVIIGLFVAFSVGHALYERRNDLGFVLEVWKQFSWKQLVLSGLAVATTITLFLTLYEAHPFFQWGWYQYLGGEAGNIAVAPASDAAQQGGFWGALIATLFVGALLVSLPFLALYEEIVFRMGIRDWKGWVWQACIFGPIHLVVGVPIAIGVALIGMGLLWGGIYWYDYRHGEGPPQTELAARLVSQRGGNMDDQRAIERAAILHAFYNTLIVTPLFLGMLTMTVLQLLQ